MFKQITHLTLTGVILTTITACVSVGPDYQKPIVTLSQSWSSKADLRQAVLGKWWRSFNDPVLERLVTDGIASNTSVAEAKAKVRLSRAQLAAKSGSQFPTLDSETGMKRSDSAGTIATNSASQLFTTRWELDLFGGNRRSVEAAYYNAEAVDEQMRAVLVIVIGDIATNYAHLREIQQNIRIARRTVTSQKNTADLTRTQLAAGQVSQVDLLSAQTQVASTLSQIPLMQIEYAKYLNNLAVLTGRSAVALAVELRKPAPIPKIPRSVPSGLPAELLDSRPDLRAAERAFASSTARVGQAQAALYPSLSLTGNIGTSGANFGDLARLSNIIWSVGPTLSIPIFEGGKLNAELTIAKANRDQSFISYRRAILTALSEVEKASVALNQNRLRYVQLRTIVNNNRKINTLMIEQFKAGNKSFIEVLTAQRDLFASETAFNAAGTDLVLSYIALQKALGGGWDGRIDTSTPEIVDTNTKPHFTTNLSDTFSAPGSRLR
ncbi:efflux transporter outer membrane subunit [Ochrobactrum sp. BTU1]|uniref:efflux transporter outer membrane subunit n=1 Tax=Ochrobactrum sp. BTU1 TaxID=2840456 RepID=UPI001C04965E|nr:efflux transporter outer membrane subunit [Ochrobactrum sp. BTU1]